MKPTQLGLVIFVVFVSFLVVILDINELRHVDVKVIVTTITVISSSRMQAG